VKRRIAVSIVLLVLVCSIGWALLRWVRKAPGAGQSQAVPLSLYSFSPKAIGDPVEGTPWIADVRIADLDKDGLRDVVVADAQRNRIGWIRQTSLGVFSEQTLAGGVAAPAHVALADMNGDQRLDVLVASMGVIPPNNDPIGSVIVLENDGHQRFRRRELLTKVARVSFVEAGDLNRDGRMDLVVAQFGYLQGGIRWLENLGDWQFQSHPLSDLPGTIHAPIVDLDGDGHLDVVALISQDIEEVHAFMGDGRGNFRTRVLHGSTNKDFGSSGLCVADLNADGRPDIIYTNGDGFDYATPGSRPWHGVQWLENVGQGEFQYRRIADLPGCYSPVVADVEGDGDLDIVVTSAFNDWSRSTSVSLLWLENDGTERFTPRVLAHKPTHLVVVDAAPMSDSGKVALVTGAFVFYPPYKHVSRVTLWQLVP
jgi:hypothetical protein